MKAVRILLLTLAALAVAIPAKAQDWPSRPVSLLVPFAAGGPIDVVARLLGPRLTEILGQQVIVENLGGAGGANGATRVARSTPDGSLFLFGNQATHTFSALMNKRLPYNPVNDFEPVSLLLSNVKVLVVRKDLPTKSLKEFVAYTKANQAKMQYGSAGAGSATHMTCVLLNGAMGAHTTHVPYRGTSLAFQDLVAGRIDYMCDVISTALPHIKAGTVTPLALLSNSRSPVLPDLPTALEQGLPGVDGDGWNAFFFPKDTPKPIVQKLAQAASETIDTPAIRERIAGLGLVLPGRAERGPAALGRLVTEELKKWGPAVKASGVSID